jgi:hypothetical protein
MPARVGERSPYRRIGQNVTGNASGRVLYCLLCVSPSFLRRVACFIGKEIWLHVERALSILKSDSAANQNAGVILGSHYEWPALATTLATSTEER